MRRRTGDFFEASIQSQRREIPERQAIDEGQAWKAHKWAVPQNNHLENALFH